MEGASLIHNVGRSRIAVSYTNIITLPVDVIVSSDDVMLTMKGGVSRAIRQAGGEAMYKEAQQAQPIPARRRRGHRLWNTSAETRVPRCMLDRSLDGSRRERSGRAKGGFAPVSLSALHDMCAPLLFRHWRRALR